MCKFTRGNDQCLGVSLITYTFHSKWSPRKWWCTSMTDNGRCRFENDTWYATNKWYTHGHRICPYTMHTQAVINTWPYDNWLMIFKLAINPFIETWHSTVRALRHSTSRTDMAVISIIVVAGQYRSSRSVIASGWHLQNLTST